VALTLAAWKAATPVEVKSRLVFAY